MNLLTQIHENQFIILIPVSKYLLFDKKFINFAVNLKEEGS